MIRRAVFLGNGIPIRGGLGSATMFEPPDWTIDILPEGWLRLSCAREVITTNAPVALFEDGPAVPAMALEPTVPPPPETSPQLPELRKGKRGRGA